LVPIIGHHLGQGKDEKIASDFYQFIYLSLALSLILFALVFLGAPLVLQRLGLDPLVKDVAQRYLWYLSIGIIPFLLFGIPATHCIRLIGYKRTMALSFAIFIAFELVYRNHYDIEHAFRSALFQVVSFITTTGLFSDDAAKWPHVTWVVLAACMFFGGCSGSTSGGIKSIRGVMLLKVVRNEFRQILHPNAVSPMKIDGVNIPQSKRVTLLGFVGLYLILTLFCAFTMIAVGIDNTNAITITLSSLGNVGPTLGMEIGPTMSWAQLPDLAKWICSFLMLVGRLELFTVLVLFTPAFWKEN